MNGSKTCSIEKYVKWEIRAIKMYALRRVKETIICWWIKTINLICSGPKNERRKTAEESYEIDRDRKWKECKAKKSLTVIWRNSMITRGLVDEDCKNHDNLYPPWTTCQDVINWHNNNNINEIREKLTCLHNDIERKSGFP